MKYLYKILRLFLCPHKYNKTIALGKISRLSEYTGDWIQIGNSYDKECIYCHKLKRFNLKI